MKIVVTGGRTYQNKELVHDTLKSYNPSRIATGDAGGADAHAVTYARANGVVYTVYPAYWEGHGRQAGPIRNEQMIRDFKPDLVLAFPGGRGTQNCIETARKHGHRVVIITEPEETP